MGGTPAWYRRRGFLEGFGEFFSERALRILRSRLALMLSTAALAADQAYRG